MNSPVTHSSSDSRATSRLEHVPVTKLRGVGSRIAEKLTRIGVRTVADMLFHLPHRYEDRTRVSPIGALRPGDVIGVVGHVDLTQVQFGRRRSLVSVISDGTGMLWMRLFHFRATQQRALSRGVKVHCFGEVRRGPKGLEMIHPEYRIVDDEHVVVEETLTPHYPATEGLHQLMLRSLTEQALAMLRDSRYTLTEHLPTSVLEDLGYPDLCEALDYVHRPPPDCELSSLEAATHPAQHRLAFEELLSHHLSLRRRREMLERLQAPALPASENLAPLFVESLSFALTTAQQRVHQEVADDLARPRPMHRLVQGDVGSGKTVIAALAALQTLEAGSQVVFMAPTELLAEQHLATFKSWFEPLEIDVGWLSGRLTGKKRQTILEQLLHGTIRMVVGTHALFQQGVNFEQLGLVIVDEQHRFGVHQRLELLDKGKSGELNPHQLIMTATPIPRTLAMTAYADLHTSVIDALPPGRQPVDTVAVSSSRRAEVVSRVHHACNDGSQAYWVCTLIDESEALQCQAATDTAAELTEALPDLEVGLVHGRMKAAEKEQVMSEFKAGALDLLVATTVIEVGVDVPNATLMIIDNAERLGLAQLHQLRGRVGRGAKKSACVMLYKSPLTEAARSRLEALRETGDGFEIARRDLDIRGPGELLGTRQTGQLTLYIADLIRDESLLPAVEKTALVMLDDHPDSAIALIERSLGDTVNYADV